MDIDRIAVRLASVNVEAARKKTRSKKKAPKVSKPGKSKSVLRDPTEWACRMELSVEVEFEGEASKAQLVKKLKTEVAAMMESAVKITARDLKLRPSDVRVRPTVVDCVIASGDNELDVDYDD